jgi:hypothetical protein
MHAAQRRMSALRKIACVRARPKPLRSAVLPESRRSRRRAGVESTGWGSAAAGHDRSLSLAKRLP